MISNWARDATTPPCFWFPDEGRVPHISLVFREMWDTTSVDRSMHWINRESEGRCSGIPHLAKNERDVGHPSFVREPGHSNRQFSRVLFSLCYGASAQNCRTLARQRKGAG